MFSSKAFRRGVSLVVVLSHLGVLVTPAVAGVRGEVERRGQAVAEASVTQSELSRLREAMRQHRLSQRLALPDEGMSRLKALFTDSPRVAAEKALASSVLSARARLLQEATEQEQSLAAVRTRLQQQQLPARILARHDAAVQTMASRRADLLQAFDRLQRDHDGNQEEARRQSLEQLEQKLEQWGGASTARTDYKHLPWGSPDSKVRAPIESRLGYQLNLPLLGVPPLQLAGPLPAGTPLPVLPSLGAAVQPTDTAENDDVRLTAAIRAKAAELGHNPARIYKWVYDTIEYIPTYGSIQGADYTLQTKRGNAFDTSSLLIGLLRASNIPARYVYGTIEVPMAKAMNWVGGVTQPEAALNLMGQGGIPHIGLVSGGTLVAARLEHVWVEAFVDFIPSRGVKHRSGDTWVPLDASFKQYTYTQPMNLQQAVPFDAEGLVTQLQTGATIDETNGYVQNLDQSKIQTALTTYQEQVKTYLEQQQPDATVGDVLGTKVIQPYPAEMLAGTLQVKHVAVAGDFHTLPDTMRHYLDFSVYATAYARDNNSPVIQRRLGLPALVGQSLALSFKPATADDEAVINSYLPEPNADGSPIDPAQLPQSLPGYLINLTPELTLNGQVIASSTTAMQLGSDVFTRTSITSPNSSLNGQLGDNVITAGEYHAIGVDGQGLSAAQLTQRKAELEATKLQLENQQFTNVTKHDLTGAILQACIQSYFATNDVQDQIAARAAGTVTYRLPSYGSFSSTLQTQFSWGIPRSVSASGVTMDVDRLTGSLVDKGGDNQRKRNFQLDIGIRMSSTENQVPEHFFATETQRAEGLSAVKAIRIADLQGQRIYTISGTNFHGVIPELTLSEGVKQEIINAVNAGKIVITSQHNIQYAGWVGAGYMVIDPESGAGAYKISGGENGGSINVSPYKDFMGWMNQYILVGWGAFADSKTGGMKAAMFPGVLADSIKNANKIKGVGYLGAVAEIAILLIESRGQINAQIAAKIATLVSIALVGEAVVGAVVGKVAKKFPAAGTAGIIAAIAITAIVMEAIFNKMFEFIFTVMAPLIVRNRSREVA